MNARFLNDGLLSTVRDDIYMIHILYMRIYLWRLVYDIWYIEYMMYDMYERYARYHMCEIYIYVYIYIYMTYIQYI